MLAGLIEWSLRNVFLVLVATLAITAAGLYALAKTPLDALPDLSDVQVIVFTEVPGQAPQVVEDQVTYPLTTAMLAVPKSRVVRGFSFFGASFVYVIFEDGTDIYWARSRVLEYLSTASKQLPEGVSPTLGPDATGVGWVYQYVLEGSQQSLDELRAIQDWYVRYQLTKAPGVAEVASVGGFVRQYSVTADPGRLRQYGVPLSRISEVIAASNRDVGGRVLEMAETEYMIRGRGYLRGIEDIEGLVVKVDGGTPVRVGDLARVELVPDERRGLAELDGEGEVVAGIAVARYGENALAVIDGLKQRIADITPGLPEGVSLRAVYDRSDLIHRAIATLRWTLVEEALIVALVCVVFLFHVRSAMVAIIMLPVGVLIAFLAMRLLGMNSNIMSLGGIAIAIGAMVDAAIVMIENAHKHIERDGGRTPRLQLIINACREVGPALFFSLLIITVSFLPVFALEAQEGRLFHPLAFTKTFAMAAGALLSVTLVPVLMLLFVRGRILPEARNPVNRFMIAAYRPVIGFVLRHKAATVGAALVVLAVSAWPASRLGSEFMPTLNEGTLLYMPSSLPGMSVTRGGRTPAATGPDHPELPGGRVGLRQGGSCTDRNGPRPAGDVRDHHQPQAREPVARGHDHGQADRRNGPGAAVPGRGQCLDHAHQGPLRHAGHGHPHADRHQGVRHGSGRDGAPRAPDRGRRAHGARHHQRVCRAPDRRVLLGHRARPGAAGPLRPARGGPAGRRGHRDGWRPGHAHRRGPRALRGHRPLPAGAARQPRSHRATGPGGRLRTGRRFRWVSWQTSASARARRRSAPRTRCSPPTSMSIRGTRIWAPTSTRPREAVARDVSFPPGYYATWSGQYEYMQRAIAKMKIVVPVTLAIIFLLLYLNFRRVTESLIVMLSVPFALVGGIWLLWALDYNLSVAVAVGFIALAGVAAETGVVMLIYLDHALEARAAARRAQGDSIGVGDLVDAIVEGAVERVRPKMMTVVAIMAGLLPIMWSTGTGSEVMRRIAAPMVGGMVSSTVLTLAVIPAIYALVKQRQIGLRHARMGN